jgi:hypothetical protein
LVILLGCGVVSLAFVGCRRSSVADLDGPEQLTLYSIDGGDSEPKAGEKLQGYPVLGKVEVTDADKRKEIVAALKEGLTRSDGTMAKCFWPRHAIRTVDKGRTLDYVICFECLQLKLHDGSSASVKPVTREPQAVFNKYLKEAGIPLAPGMNSEEQ